MSEPRRWRDEGAPDEIRRMLAAGQPSRSMPGAVQRRMQRRLGAALATSTGLFLVGWKSLALAATLGVTSFVVTRHIVTREAPRVESAPASLPRRPARTSAAPPALPPSAAAPEILPEPVVEAPAPTRRAQGLTAPRAPRPAEVAEAQPPEDTLASELALLTRARAELDRDPTAALASLEEHARTFAGGKLTIERELLALDVLERLGRTADARTRAERLLERARGTIYEARVRARHAPR